MQVLNCLLALGGDTGNTVPKYGVTPAEIAVLCEIHGAGAVLEIEVVDEVRRSHREEVARLEQRYARTMPDGTRFSEEVRRLFPGASARVFEDIGEMELPDDVFKAARHQSHGGRYSRSAQNFQSIEPDLSDMTARELRSYAQARDIDLGSAIRKSDIIALINAAKSNNDADLSELAEEEMENANDADSGDVDAMASDGDFFG